MPDLKITAKMPKEKVLELINATWTHLKVFTDKLDDPNTKKDALLNDYALMVEFLTDKEKVIKYLQPLETAVKTKLENSQKAEVQTLKTTVDDVIKTKDESKFGTGNQYTSKPIKTHKIVSSALEEYENQKSFNSAQSELQRQSQVQPTGKLHTQAKITGDPSLAAMSTQPDWKDYNLTGATKRDDLADLTLPKGPPTLSGILNFSFNPILLRNGFHWKDPGADSLVHGEFTHRFQWYAIGKACDDGQLAVVNTPLQLFKSMGHVFSKANNKGHNQKQQEDEGPIYIWELVCDNFNENRYYAGNKPHTGDQDCFTCPDFLNRFLSLAIGTHPLPYLNVLMRARWIKRKYEAKLGQPLLSTDKIGDGRKKFGFGVKSDKDEAGSAIWWVEH